MGVKYVNDFKFPKEAGFTGSRGQVAVRPHMRQGYAKGGKVRGRPPLKPSPEQVLGGTIAAGAAAAAYDKLRRREEAPPPTPPRMGREYSTPDLVKGKLRRDRERDLGLKKGGRVRKKDC